MLLHTRLAWSILRVLCGGACTALKPLHPQSSPPCSVLKLPPRKFNVIRHPPKSLKNVHTDSMLAHRLYVMRTHSVYPPPLPRRAVVRFDVSPFSVVVQFFRDCPQPGVVRHYPHPVTPLFPPPPRVRHYPMRRMCSLYFRDGGIFFPSTRTTALHTSFVACGREVRCTGTGRRGLRQCDAAKMLLHTRLACSSTQDSHGAYCESCVEEHAHLTWGIREPSLLQQPWRSPSS